MSEIAIRARRAAFNRALAEHDASAIGPFLSRDCVMLTGTDSAVIAGRMAQVKVWKRQFSEPGPITYVRTPGRIVMSAVEPIALEHGVWIGQDAAGAQIASGDYSAKWREIRGEWQIEAELFLTLA